MAGGKTGWTVVRTTSMLAAIIASRKALDAGWRFVTGREPPKKSYDPTISWPELIAWVTTSAVATAAVKVLADRGAAKRWQAWTGVYPPDVDTGRRPAKQRRR